MLLRMRNLALLFLTVCLAAGVTGCSPAVRAPYSLAPSSWDAWWEPTASQEEEAASATPEPERLLTQGEPLSPMNLVDLSLRRNPTTKIAWAKARSKAALYGQSLSTYYPAIAGEAFAERQKSMAFSGTPLTRSQFWSTDLGIQGTLSYTLFDFGQRSSAAQQAYEDLVSTDWLYNADIQSTVFNVLNDYYAYVGALASMKAQEANLQDAMTTFEVAAFKREAGVQDVSDELQAKAQLLSEQLQWVAQEQQAQAAYATLAAEAGLSALDHFAVQPFPEELSLHRPELPLDDLVATANALRPDLASSKANVLAKQSGLDNADAARLPVLGFSLTADRTRYPSSDFIGTGVDGVISLSMPLFQGGYYENLSRQAKADLEQARAELEQKELLILKEVKIAHTNYLLAEDNWRISEEFLVTAKEAYIVTLAKYKAGTGTYMDLVNAQTNLANARYQLVSAKQGWFTSLANLALATGTLGTPQQPAGEGLLPLIPRGKS